MNDQVELENSGTGKPPADGTLAESIRRMMAAGKRFRAAKSKRKRPPQTRSADLNNARQCPPGDN